MKRTNHITWEIRDEIGILTLDNPPKNYFHDPGLLPLDTIHEWLSEKLIKGVLLHGNGKHFSAGGDLDHLRKLILSGSDIQEKISNANAVITILSELQIPVVAAIHGICFGAGLELALAAHIRIGAENLLFAFPETNHGIIPGWGGTRRLCDVTGFSPALRMILTGDMLNASEALAIRLIDEIVPKSGILHHAFRLLVRMTRDRDIRVIRSVIKALQHTSTLTRDEAIREETRMFCELAIAEVTRMNTRKD